MFGVVPPTASVLVNLLPKLDETGVHEFLVPFAFFCCTIYTYSIYYLNYDCRVEDTIRHRLYCFVCYV